jgi:hypothetical protein
MSHSQRFRDAFTSLAAAEQNRVSRWLDGWEALGDGIHDQIVKNIRGESALSPPVLAELLKAAATCWASGTFESSHFSDLCKSYRRRGVVLAPPSPAWLGRVEKLENYIRRRMTAAPPGITQDDVADELGMTATSSGTAPPQGGKDTLLKVTVRPGPLGRINESLFATFQRDRTSRPFVPPMSERDTAVNLLGLGYTKSTDWVLAVVYEPGAAISLRVPTIGDAGSYHFFRPPPCAGSGDPDCGVTCPLSVTYDEGCPEVVHEDCGWHFVNLA